MPIHFDTLKLEVPKIQGLQQKADATGFFIQEVLRFYSIVGTLQNINLSLDLTSSSDERYFTHVLSRSLLEPFFIILYIFDDLSQMSQINTRYEEQKNSFKNEYRKLMNDLNQPEWQTFMQNYGVKLEVADPQWSSLSKLPDIKTILKNIKRNNRSLEYLYPIYRITSFDTHGRSLGTIFESVFGKQCNFPVLSVELAIEYMSDEYLVLLNDLRNNALI